MMLNIKDKVKTDCGLQGTIDMIGAGHKSYYVIFDCGLQAWWSADKLSLINQSKFNLGDKVYIEAKVSSFCNDHLGSQLCHLSIDCSTGPKYIYLDDNKIIKKEDIK